MEYFYNLDKKSTAAHIWVGSDTACRMLSTGGMKRGGKKVHKESGERRICVMCQSNVKKYEGMNL